MESQEIKDKPANDSQEVVLKQHFFLPPTISLLTILILLFLIYALFSGITYKFYASFLFFFYSYIKRMWLSVICLGVFQTIILIPLRIINLRRSMHIKEFISEVEGLDNKKGQRLMLKANIMKGNVNLLWYLINFSVQTISYFSLGRLFLTDFYSQKLNPKLLYSFVAYPEYPIKDVFFKIPYIVFTQTRDFGIGWVWLVWIILIAYKLIISRFIHYYRKKAKQLNLSSQDRFPVTFIKNLIRYSSGSIIVFMILAWFLIRYFPLSWQFRIFSGDVSRPNRTLNTITALLTAFIVIWLDLPKIFHKAELARQENVSKKIIDKTQIELFKHTFQKALFLGLGAFFITNLIPSAFELSIFTLESISLISPLTLDRLVLGIQTKIPSKISPKIAPPKIN